MNAICMRCGHAKQQPSRKCRHCGLADDEMLVRSVYLSPERFDDPDEQRKYAEELLALSEALKSGRQVDFDEHELQRLREQLQAVNEVRWRHVFVALFRIFLPMIIVLATLYGVILLLRSMR